ncbi:MAG: serine/threonine protein kinase psk1 [Vezdaea aestivalis]|nr:MAG: serine/threonine protein kinase psk1 [Vezdaea aestivalis]
MFSFDRADPDLEARLDRAVTKNAESSSDISMADTMDYLTTDTTHITLEKPVDEDVTAEFQALHLRDKVTKSGEAANYRLVPGTPPINIAPVPTRPSRLGMTAASQNATQTHGSKQLGPKNAPKRKRKKKAVNKASPAMKTIRGFTPAGSGDEDSDWSAARSTATATPRIHELASGSSSPTMRPSSSSSQGGISALKLQLDTLNLNSVSRKSSLVARYRITDSIAASSSSSPSQTPSESDTTEMGTYEVSLEHDFVSPDIVSKPVMGIIEGGLAPSRKITAKDFEPLRCLGKGAYGTVILVRQTSTGRLFAQKQFRKASMTVHKKLVEQTKTERAILESVNRHPFVVKLFYAFQDHEKLYLILEYAQGGELFTHLAAERMFSEEFASFYMAEMVLALEHLHRNVGVLYRDLKPENCLLDNEGHLLLTDFGLSKVAVEENEECRSILGTIEYMAPEVIQGCNYGMAVDWWSLGALGFDLLTGSPPFPANNHAKIQEKIVKQKLVLPYYLSPDSKDLLTRLLRKDPAKRLGNNMPKDLHTIKKHRFFRKIDWRKLERRELEPPIKPIVTDPEAAENFAKEFTDLALSPVVERGMMGKVGSDNDPFGGFSFVASESLLEYGAGYMDD